MLIQRIKTLKKLKIKQNKAKKGFSADDPNLVIVAYKDGAIVLDGLKKTNGMMPPGLN